MMKKIFFIIIVNLTLVPASHAQKASDGKAVVSKGFENSDSVRFGLLKGYDIGQWLHQWYEPVDSGYARVDRYMDSLGVNVPEDWDQIEASKKFFGHQRVECALGTLGGNYVDLRGFAQIARQRMYLPIIHYDYISTWRWRYNDLLLDSVHTRYYDNTYDSEDISPYVEFPANDSFVAETFHTLRYGSDSIVYNGNEGRVILGYSDERNAQPLLTVPLGFPFPSVPGKFDSAKAFSVNLEFAIDTSKIDMTDDPNPTDTDDAPLVRLQVMYKDSSQSVLPFVPFKTVTDTTKPGWFLCLDTLISRKVYRSLPDDWRADDSMFDASGGHRAHSWRFKQLHAMIHMDQAMMHRMKWDSVSNALFRDSYDSAAFGFGSSPGGNPDFAFTNQDSVVGLDSLGYFLQNNLLEMRILSTYRATVRIRDLTWQDTMTDRYMHREKFGTITHSVEQNRLWGGNDTLMDSAVTSWAAAVDSNIPREIMYNDISLPPDAFPAAGYVDWLGSKHNVYVHMRPQDWGDFSIAFRRDRMSFDGQPPSMFESQNSGFGSPVLPYDYIYYDHPYSSTERSKPWGQSKLDTLLGAIIGRSGDTSSLGTDTLRAYKLFESQVAYGTKTLLGIRRMSHVLESHPWSKRFAPEYSIESFRYVTNGAYDSLSKNLYLVGGVLEHVDSLLYQGYYDSTLHVWINPSKYGTWPSFTPEILSSIIYGAFANGATGISAGEAFGNMGPPDWGTALPGSGAHAIGIFSPDSNTDSANLAQGYIHSYNNGHYFTCRQWPLNYPYESDVDGPMQDWYLGLSNTYRTYQRATNRLKMIWNAGQHPMSFDPDTEAYVDVGLFEDSISTAQKNYAALVVNFRCWPSLRDTVDTSYYNSGLPLKDHCHSTLGDIDVRKVYLKLDLSKTDPTFSNHVYYVVRDLWHPDSTWLLNKDSSFAVYIKPGDAKFLYFEPGIAVNVAARTGTDTGVTSAPEFCFNNGRRVAEIENHTRDVVCYTRNNHLYVAYPAAGYTVGGSPDASSGDNIITGYEQALDTTHTCARPSLAVAMNDTGVALTYWYKDGSGNGRIGAAYRKAPDSAWRIVTLNPSSTYPDPSSDYSQVTPTITPINDTSWLIAAGWHPSGGMGHIFGLFLMTPKTGSPYAGSSAMTLASDIIRSDHSIALALFPTLASRRMSHSAWNVHMAWQIDSIAGAHQIYFTRFDSLPNNLGLIEAPTNVSKDLNACDNVHPSLAIGGTYEFAGWVIPWTLPVLKIAYDSFYHDELAWEAETNWQPPSGGGYRPILRARHEGFSPTIYPGLWGVYNLFNIPGANHYPEPNAEDRKWDYKYASPTDTSHDWVRLLYQNGSQLNAECWAPNWYHFILNEYGYEPSTAQSTGDFGPWPDNGAVERSICWTATGTNPHVRITNGYMPRIQRKFAYPNVLVTTGNLGCDTLVAVGYGPPVVVPPSPNPRETMSWNPASPSLGGPSPAWHNPEDIPNVMTTNVFTVSACDSIIVPRSTITNGLTVIQDSLRSLTDYVMVRLFLRHAVDSSWFGTVDSMIVTSDSIHWPGVTTGLEADTARYKVSCGASTDSVFLSMDVERGDTTNSIERAYVMVMDTDSTAQPAEKRAIQQSIQSDQSPLALHVYPNPAKSTTRICVEALPGGYPATVEVVNELGDRVALLYDDTPQGDIGFCMNFDCSSLPSGNYYVHVQDAIMGTSARLSIVK